MTILATLSNNGKHIASRYIDVPAFASQRSLVRKAKQALKIKGKSIVTISPDDFTPFQDTPIIRTALYFESFGNFASVCYSYKGKKHSTLNYELIEMES